MKNIRMIVYWSQDQGLTSYYITDIDKGIKRRQKITNVVLPSRWEISVCWTIARSDSRLIIRRDIKYMNNIGGPIKPSNYSFLL